MRAEMSIKFKCGKVAKVYFVTMKHETAEATEIYLRASLDDFSFLGKTDVFNHNELIRVSDLTRSVYEGLSKVTLAEFKGNIIQVGVKDDPRIKFGI